MLELHAPTTHPGGTPRPAMARALWDTLPNRRSPIPVRPAQAPGNLLAEHGAIRHAAIYSVRDSFATIVAMSSSYASSAIAFSWLAIHL
jgi:hypothetical protein